jgi:hypothetical protein
VKENPVWRKDGREIGMGLEQLYPTCRQRYDALAVPAAWLIISFIFLFISLAVGSALWVAIIQS